MRNMSFALTTAQVLRQDKDVTRRLGWLHLKAGDFLRPVKKCMGLKPGEKIEPVGACIEVVSVRRERLDAMHAVDYGFAECSREGFPEMSPAEHGHVLQDTPRLHAGHGNHPHRVPLHAAGRLTPQGHSQ